MALEWMGGLTAQERTAPKWRGGLTALEWTAPERRGGLAVLWQRGWTAPADR